MIKSPTFALTPPLRSIVHGLRPQHILAVAKSTVVPMVLIAAASLSGCAEARRTMGLEKAPPDEFTVVSSAPLSQPPDYSLRPPIPGAPRPQQGTTTDQAYEAITGTTGSSATVPSPGEKVLLSKAGSTTNTPEIRNKVDEETTGLVQASHSFTDHLLFWKDDPMPGEPLDPSKEAQRLKDNAASGKPPAEGDNVLILSSPPGSGWFAWIF
jgi:hypothetical protein